MSKVNEPDALDPVPGDDVAAETPRDTVDPVPDRVGCDSKPTRKRKPSLKRKAKGDAT